MTLIFCSGCGIGGLTLAAFLSKSPDIKIDLYETKADVSTIGAAIALWKRPWEALQELGFEEDVAKRGIPIPKDAGGK
jgi:salicylate hydroxylase